MPESLALLAQKVGGQIAGNPSIQIHGAETLSAAGPKDITLFDGTGKDNRISETAAAAVVVPRGYLLESLPVIQVDNVREAFAMIVRLFRPPRTNRQVGISPKAVVSPLAKLADDVNVHSGATIEDDVEIGAGSTIYAGVQIMAGCKIGQNVLIFPNAILYENTIVGARSMIHAGAVLGAYGFGYETVDNRHQLSVQLGHVEIGADVEIGACTTIDRGTYGPTVIGEGTKIDNLVMIAHNCRIGQHNMICSQVGIAGSTTTGDDVVIAGQVGVCDHVHIGKGAVLGAMAGVTNDVPEGANVLGAPATGVREQKIRVAAIAKLPDMRRQLKQLQRTVERLSRQVNEESRTNESDSHTA